MVPYYRPIRLPRSRLLWLMLDSVFEATSARRPDEGYSRQGLHACLVMYYDYGHSMTTGIAAVVLRLLSRGHGDYQHTC